MNSLIVQFRKQATEYCAKYGLIPALWYICDEYHYARNTEEKASWHVLIAELRKKPEYAKHLPKLPEIN